MSVNCMKLNVLSWYYINYYCLIELKLFAEFDILLIDATICKKQNTISVLSFTQKFKQKTQKFTQKYKISSKKRRNKYKK